MRGLWRVRVTIPNDLHAVLGKNLVHALGNKNQSEAKGLGKSHIDEFLNQIDDAYDGIIPENPVIEGNKLVKVT